MSRIKKTALIILILSLISNIANLHTNALSLPQINAKNAMLIQLDTGLVMYEKNADDKIYPGFTTKVMTALVVCDKVKNLSDKVKVGDNFLQDIQYVSSLNFKKSEEITVLDLLYCMIVSTSSEASNILAQHVAGSNDNFALLMTDKAKSLGAKNTVFTNPHGINDDRAYTTARDSSLILLEYIKNSKLMEIANAAFYRMPATNMSPERKLYTTNYLLLPNNPYYLGSAKGIKNSYDKDNGYGLSTLAEKKKNRVLALVFGCQKTTENGINTVHSFTDIKTLVNWAFDNFITTQLLKANTPYAQIKVNLSQKYDSVTLVSASDFKTMMPKDYDASKLQFKPVTAKSVDAPLEKGQKVGTLDIIYAGKKIGSVDLLSNTSVKLDMLLFYGNQINKFFSSLLVKIAAISIVSLFLIYIIYTIIYNRKRSRYRSVKRRMKF